MTKPRGNKMKTQDMTDGVESSRDVKETETGDLLMTYISEISLLCRETSCISAK